MPFIYKIISISDTLTFASGDTSKYFDFLADVQVENIHINIPDFSATTGLSATFTLTDENSNILFSGNGYANNSVNNIYKTECLSGKMRATVGLNMAPSGVGGDVTVKLRGLGHDFGT